ncbi:MAG: ATPase, partial [Actinomycetota bacterium]|nr:ATPase [Actinomycetota bacterium]
IATLMEGYWGMGRTVASHGVTQKVGIGGGGRPGKKGEGGPEKDMLDTGLGERIEEKLEELLIRTGELLAENRRAVLAVAHALETHKTVTGDDVQAVIEGQAGPLIDRRVYRDPGFMATAEAYHARAVAAHKGHGQVDVALPRFNGSTEVEGTLELEPVTAEPRSNGAPNGWPNPWARPPSAEAPSPPPPAPPPPPAAEPPAEETE